MRAAARSAVVVTVLAMLVACVSGEEPSPDPGGPATSGAAETVAWSGPADVADRCLSRTPPGDVAAPVTVEAAGTRLVAAEVAPDAVARVGAIMLPQIGESGLCGWLPFAAQLSGRGVHSLAVDPCGFGESACDGAPTIGEQVDLAADWLRQTAGVEQVVLLGASMGGSLTVLAVQDGASVDAWVSLSGPSAWEGRTLLDGAGRMPAEGLVVRARNDGAAMEFAAARDLARAAAARFVAAPEGHGWDLLTTLSMRRLTRVGERVADFVVAAAG